jgi:hypothetical protein
VDKFGTESGWFLTHPSKMWLDRLPVDRADAVRIAVAVIDLVLPEWRAARPGDTVPLRAVEAANSNPRGTDSDLRKHARALAKGCTESRRRSLGYEHRIAEAARALASAAAAASESAAMEAVGEALEKVEEHLLYRFAVAGVYGKEADVRGQMLRRVVEASALDVYSRDAADPGPPK